MLMSVVSGILAIAYGIVDILYPELLHSKFLVLIIFFFIQSIPIAWLLRQGEKDPSNFVMYALGSIGLRMITGLFLLVFFYVLKVEDIVSLSIQFLVVYLVYLVFELTVVLANLRRN